MTTHLPTTKHRNRRGVVQGGLVMTSTVAPSASVPAHTAAVLEPLHTPPLTEG